MVNNMYCALKKDFTEYMRKHYNILFAVAAILICCGIFASTMLLPRLLERLSYKRPELISDSQAMADFMLKLFPTDAKGNLGTVVSNFCMFYSLVVVLSVFRTIPNEIEGSKWLTPLLCGYKKTELLLSKCIIFGLGSAVPVVILTLVYYELATMFFPINLSFFDAMVYAIVVGIIELCMCVITISLSVVCKHSIIAAISVIGIVYTVPDLFNYLSFGKMLPTYMFTYIYSYSTDYKTVVIPSVGMIVLSVLFLIQAIVILRKKAI